MEFLLDNIFYVVIAVVSGSMLIWPLLRPKAGCPEISTLDATMGISKLDAAVLDVRSAEQYAQGHLPRARNIPAKEMSDRVGELARMKIKPGIITGEDASGGIGSAAKVRKQNGFADVMILEGGVAAWRKADLPLEK